ncbi:primosomal protein [Mycobacterium sp. CVI_P3]|uniref:Primosomal protein n=1 Tax=Mycobacterium pinniadriaticum TaxID=2994102 RepID=A0ABT3SKN0_9MYCO|nr:primosomal protein [Mycobacterium pinniadriaticum]MCX2933628.1 primosomal protein [Mycobacterium pinniadriaticum]MCX2940085.1 primosomal protein [Mycobacterium pinniadriaticum]
MAAELVPVRIGVTAGDLYTLWAPRWRDGGDEWEAFLGKDEDLFAFESVADLAAFVRTNTDNDLADHPGWEDLVGANAHKLVPKPDREVDLISVEETLSEKPTEESVTALANTMAIVSSIGSVCELPAVTRFFNGNPNLGLLSGGIEQFSGKSGRKRWSVVGEIVGRGWDGVLSAIDEVITTPEVDERAAKLAADELEEPYEEETEEPSESAAGEDADEDAGEPETEKSADERAPQDDVVLGSDEDFWAAVGIDPVRITLGSGTLYTLRCYFDDRPIFLGRNGRISVFGSERSLARYLADQRDHDLSDLSTYDDIHTAATDGSLRVDVTEDNIYMLTGLSDDISDGPDTIDRDQLELAVELVRDVGEYSEEDVVDRLLAQDRPLGKLVDYVLDPEENSRPAGPYAAAVQEWEEIERFVESRLRRE